MDNTTQINLDDTLQKGSDLLGKTINPQPVPSRKIGIDVDDDFYKALSSAVQTSSVDISSVESLSNVSQSRETMFEIIDTMSEDTTISAVLETYAEDATELSDSGRIIWCQSDDPNVMKYVTFLLDTLNLDKNVFKYAYCLCKYGDVYLKMTRESEYRDDLFSTQRNKGNKKADLNESVYVNAYSPSDHYALYVEMVDNPAEMFELTQLGKTYAYVKADVRNSQTRNQNTFASSAWKYSFQTSDINIYDAKSFVHAALEDNFTRFPEELEIFIPDKLNKENKKSLNYKVKKGQSLLQSIYRIWRNLTLLENSLLLNRLTKSSILRIIGVEVGDMPKEEVGPHMRSIKSLIEQKTSLDTNNRMQEYTNPGPMENCIYVPTHNGIGGISTQQVGGDVDVKGLADLDYFKDKMFSGLKAPKQYFGDTTDNAGFSGGQSLALISSRYAKTIKRIQNGLLQMFTDAINLILIDKGMDSYVNNFTLKMQAPMTQEEVDRRDNNSTKVGIIQDIMNLLDGVDDESVKLRILKVLLSEVITDQSVIQILQEQIDKLEQKEEEEKKETSSDNTLDKKSFTLDVETIKNTDEKRSIDNEEDRDVTLDTHEDAGREIIDKLPTPSELGKDFTDSDTEETQ